LASIAANGSSRRTSLFGLAEGAEARPAAEQHRVEHRDREGAVDLRLLRQVGDAPRAAFDPALEPSHQPEHRLEQRALARAVGADDGGDLAGRDLGRDVMHGGMPVVGDREVDQLQRRIHSAHHTASHSTVARPSAQAMRWGALMPRRAVPGEGGEPRMHQIVIILRKASLTVC